MAATRQQMGVTPSPHLNPIDLRQQLRDHAVHDSARVGPGATGGSKGVHFVEEHHAGGRPPRSCKDLPDLQGGSEHLLGEKGEGGAFQCGPGGKGQGARG